MKKNTKQNVQWPGHPKRPDSTPGCSNHQPYGIFKLYLSLLFSK